MIGQLLSVIERVLPERWRVEMVEEPLDGGDRGADLALRVGPSPGRMAEFLVQAKRTSTLPTAVLMADLERLRSASGAQVVLATDYVNRPARAACEERGIGYVDTTGWIRLVSERPPLFISAQGSERPPKLARGAVVLDRLSGDSAARVMETLLLVDLPVGVRELAQAAGVAPGTVSKILPTLQAAGAVTRSEAGAVSGVRRRLALERWTQDYRFETSNKDVIYGLHARGVDPLLDKLRGREDCAVTSAYAAPTYLPDGVIPVVTPPRVSVYAAEPIVLVGDLRIREVDPLSANCVLVRAPTRVVASARPTTGDLRVVGLARCLADLMTSPGRESLIADQLMDYLAVADPGWSE